MQRLFLLVLHVRPEQNVISYSSRFVFLSHLLTILVLLLAKFSLSDISSHFRRCRNIASSPNGLFIVSIVLLVNTAVLKDTVPT